MALAVLMAAAPAAPAATTSRPLRTLVEDFSKSLRDWRQSGAVMMRRESDLPGPALRLTRSGRGGAGTFRHSLPGGAQAVSFDLRLSARSTLTLLLGSGQVRFTRGTDDAVTVEAGGERTEVDQRSGWRGKGWRHVTVTGSSDPVLTVDGVTIDGGPRASRQIAFRIERGNASLAALLASPQQNANALLLHRLAELAAQTRPGRFSVGTGADDGVLRFSNGWTSGFWPGSLWLAADMTRRSDLFRRWAIDATLRHFGHEDDDVHDLGFMYMQSSVAAYERLCPARDRAGRTRCTRLRKSGLDAAKNLLSIFDTNSVAGTLPTSSPAHPCRDCGPDEADTIVDSMMNLSLLVWAGGQMHDKAYRRAAARSAEGVARLLVRADGSTAQSVHVRRSDGTVIKVHTHQGFADDSTWARGQGWGIYGFAQTGASLRRPALLQVAERLAGYVESHLPADGVPLYDYAAPAGSPVDTSAGVITAVGLDRLADACGASSGSCGQPASHWRTLGRRMLAASLRLVNRRPPLGFLGSQVFSLGGSATWDDGGEFIFGTNYALEGVKRRLFG